MSSTRRSTGRRRTRSDRGSAVVVLAVVMVMGGVMAVGVARVGTAVVQRADAQAAADAAALAGVRGGRPAATRLARSNGATIVRFTRRAGEVTVRVRIGGAEASARATAGP